MTTPRSAATLIIAAQTGPSESQEDFSVLLVKRTRHSGFMAGAHVFPGGVVDTSDSPSMWSSTFDLHTELTDLEFRMCAIRETFEETGVLLINTGGTVRAASIADKETWRSRVRNDASVFREMCQTLGVKPAVADIQPWARWITPEQEPKRYDARFYLVGIDTEVHAEHDQSETVASTWLSPTQTLHDFDARNLFLPPPTWIMIRELQSFRSSQRLLSAERDLNPVQPHMVQQDGHIHLLFPEDSEYPGSQANPTQQKVRIVVGGEGLYRFIDTRLKQGDLQ